MRVEWIRALAKYLEDAKQETLQEKPRVYVIRNLIDYALNKINKLEVAEYFER